MPGATPSRTPLLPHLPVQLVGYEHHHDIALAGRLGGLLDRQSVLTALPTLLGVRAQSDDDRYAGVLQIQCVGVALGAVADDRDRLAVEPAEVGVVVVEHGAGA